MKRYSLIVGNILAPTLYAMPIGEDIDVVFSPCRELAEWYVSASKATAAKMRLQRNCPTYTFLRDLQIVEVDLEELRISTN